MSTSEQTLANQVLVFTLDDLQHALPLSAVERVVRAVEITALPGAPEMVQGVINAQGWIVPVLDLRKRFHLPARETDVDDRFILVRTSKRLVALAVDSVIGIRAPADGEIVNAEHTSGMVELDGDLVMIQDPEQLLSADEERMLDAALSGGTE